MKKLLIAASALTIFSSIAHADENKVCFNYPISSYDYLDGKASDEQTLNPAITIDGNCLVIEAGRSLSSTPVSWVKDGMQSAGYDWVKGNMVHTGDGLDSTPDKLNFAVKLNLYINLEANGIVYGTYQCNNVYLGQGGDGAGAYNWWVFANNNSGQQSISCYPVGYTRSVDLVGVSKHGISDNNFNLSF